MEVLTFGSLNLDHVYPVDHFVRPGESLTVSSHAVHPGGKGLNQSIAMARAGAKVSLAGCIGTDGIWLQDLAASFGIDTRFLRPADAVQGHAIIQVHPSGENCILYHPGSNLCISETQITETLGAFSAGDYLVLQNEINRLDEIVEQAHARGLTVILNPSPYNEGLDRVDFGLLNWLFINEVEMEQITGQTDPESAFMELHLAYPQLSVLITLGAEGSIGFRMRDGAMEIARCPAFPTEAVDTTGAGDTYTGFFVKGLTEDLPLMDCMRRASMAASISVSRNGAASSIPSAEEVNQALTAWQA